MRMLADKDATLTLLHVVTQPIAMMATPAPDISGLFDSAEHWLKDIVNETQAALHAAGSTSKVDGVLLEGHPGISVVSWARDSDVDLVVAASHRGHFDRALLGSFATYVAYHSPVRRPSCAPGDGRRRRRRVGTSPRGVGAPVPAAGRVPVITRTAGRGCPRCRTGPVLADFRL